MSHKSDGKWSNRDSDLDELEDSYYDDLKKGNVKLKISESRYRCPYCPGREDDYTWRELRDHGSRRGCWKSSTIREKAKHLALQRFIDRYLSMKRDHESTHQTKPKVPSADDHHSASASLKRSSSSISSIGDAIPLPELKVPKTEHPDHKVTPLAQPKLPKEDSDQLFVYPWIGIVANIKTEFQEGRCVAASGKRLKDQLAEQGFGPQRVQPVWTYRGHSGFALVEFKKDWDGFKCAMDFEKSFEVKSLGKKDFFSYKLRGEELYGWVARHDDYQENSKIGVLLNKMGDVKTVSDLEKEDQNKTSKLLLNLRGTLDTREQQLEDIKTKFERTNIYMKEAMQQTDDLMKKYYEEIRKTQQRARDYSEKVYLDHQKAVSDLEAQRIFLLQREEQIMQDRALYESERRKLEQEKKWNESATLEQKKADENMLQLDEDHKKEKEKLHKKIIELEKQLDSKHALELEIEQLQGSLDVMKHMKDDDAKREETMKQIEEELKDKKEDLDNMDALYQSLIVQERKSNDELQDGRKELVKVFSAAGCKTQLGVKMMGQLNKGPFRCVVKRKYLNAGADDVKKKVDALWGEWKGYLGDPQWHPFKMIQVPGGHKEIINEEDEKLKNLKNELGDEIWEAVITALTEMNEYNASGRYPVGELWNMRENRKASLKEGVVPIVNQWRKLKGKKPVG
ncbi:factor of DNA methylation 4-like [Rutidosis leptorrhynchoides]|uniref:factor of DNA methylation 4-like n=1 Tax=Rutidosis leptorrhynchoides TaxID=125765 RepID=UPI003A9A579E